MRQQAEAAARPALVEVDAETRKRLGKWDANGAALCATCKANESIDIWMSCGGNACAKYLSNSGGKMARPFG